MDKMIFLDYSVMSEVVKQQTGFEQYNINATSHFSEKAVTIDAVRRFTVIVLAFMLYILDRVFCWCLNKKHQLFCCRYLMDEVCLRQLYMQVAEFKAEIQSLQKKQKSLNPKS